MCSRIAERCWGSVQDHCQLSAAPSARLSQLGLMGHCKLLFTEGNWRSRDFGSTHKCTALDVAPTWANPTADLSFLRIEGLSSNPCYTNSKPETHNKMKAAISKMLHPLIHTKYWTMDKYIPWRKTLSLITMYVNVVLHMWGDGNCWGFRLSHSLLLGWWKMKAIPTQFLWELKIPARGC